MAVDFGKVTHLLTEPLTRPELEVLSVLEQGVLVAPARPVIEKLVEMLQVADLQDLFRISKAYPEHAHAYQCYLHGNLVERAVHQGLIAPLPIPVTAEETCDGLERCYGYGVDKSGRCWRCDRPRR